jgi:N-formylglutamate deformylase
MPDIFEHHQGNSPLLVSFPHDGIEIPPDLLPRFKDIGKKSVDADWFISKPYEFIHALDISFIKPRYSRYVVDLNRSPEGELLYPGKMETGICPHSTFNGDPIYLEGKEPDKDEIQSRIDTYWRPYHHHIRTELDRIKKIHGRVILWEAHSIPGEVPQLFDGVLPDLNFGTADGASCEEHLINEVVKLAKLCPDYSVVLNGRFKGGYITRHYGDPANNIHSIQLEINQRNYLSNSESPAVDHVKSQRLSQLLEELIHQVMNLN